jgi:hypothetical protein
VEVTLTQLGDTSSRASALQARYHVRSAHKHPSALERALLAVVRLVKANGIPRARTILFR